MGEKTMKALNKSLVIMMLVLTGICLFGKEPDVPEDKPSPDTTYLECDLKSIQKFYHCGEENKLLRGLICPICIGGKCEWQKKTTTAGGPGHSPKDNKEYHAIDSLPVDFKCPCCNNPLKNLKEVDLLIGQQCRYCGLAKISQKEYCVKWAYGCSDDHQGILIPGNYLGKCPEVMEDTDKNKTKRCNKPLDKVELSVAEVIYKYICPSCKKEFDAKTKQCDDCKKDLVKKKTCTKSGTFPHLDERQRKKQQEAKRSKLEEEKRKQQPDK